MSLQYPRMVKESTLEVCSTVEEYEVRKAAEERKFYLYKTISCLEDEDGSSDFLSTTAFIVKSILDINEQDREVSPKDRKPIIIYINSPGGDPVEAFSLISAIELSKTPIYTVNVGQWSSAAFLIGITGHKRFSFPNSTFLLHDGSLFAFGSATKVQDRVEFDRCYEEKKVKPHVLNHSKMTEVDYNAVARVEFYLLPEGALEKGFIDEIITDIDAIL